MERFILQLKADHLARIHVSTKGSTFIPLSVSDASRTRPATHLGSKSLDNFQVPRYGEAPSEKKQPATPGDEQLITAANGVLRDRGWPEISEYYNGSITAAKKILRSVPIDRAVPLVEEAVRLFNPASTGGELLKSLGHPFITTYVIKEFRRQQRDRDQLPLLPQLEMSIERSVPRQIDREPDRPPAPPETVDTVGQEWRAIANSSHRPKRIQ